MRLVLLAILAASPAKADSLVATQTIRAQTILTAEDFVVVDADIPGTLTDPAAAIGLEARVTLYAGRPISMGDVGAAAVVERNQTVSLIYRSGGLSILTEGKALARGGPGDIIKVMNLSSRTTVMGIIGADGTVAVTSPDKG